MINLFLKKGYLLLLFSICSISLSASENALQKLTAFAKHFATFANNYPQEKVYLHFDNTSYYQGENIWFKAYVVTAEQNALTRLSKTLYVELLTPEGNIVESKKLKIENGQCHGEFFVRDSVPSGYYEMRAYTRSMLNFGKDAVFSRVFPVFEKPLKAGHYESRKIRERYSYLKVPGPRADYSQKGSLNVSFFPEGGNLIAGVRSKVAFKATGHEGENALVEGAVYDALGEKVAEFSNEFKGMGTFEFTPGTGKYTAKVQYNKSSYSFDLPQAMPSGYAFSVDNASDENMDIRIQKSDGLAPDSLGLTLACRGKVYVFDEEFLNAGNSLLVTIPKRLLPTGVIQISLFNTHGEVLCERLAFVDHHSQMKMNVIQNKSQYQPFEKVDMDFQVNDNRGVPVETTFSVAVRDAATTSGAVYADNILTNLLLSSEVKGYIENPGYYFESNDPSRKAALDLLLLTQGWSRYVWKQMAGVTPFEVRHPIEKSLLIEGRVLSSFKKKQMENVDVSMILMKDSLSQKGTCVTDKEGKFNLALEDFYGKAELILQTKEKSKRKENYILLDRIFSPEVKPYSCFEKQIPGIIPINITSDTTSVLTNTIPSKKAPLEARIPIDKKSHLLKEVTVKGKKRWKLEDDVLKYANIVYDVEKTVDQNLDKNEEEPTNIEQFLLQTNPYFSSTQYGDSMVYTYKQRRIGFFLNDGRVTFPVYEIMTDRIEKVIIIERQDLPNFGGIYLYTYKDGYRRIDPIGIRKTKLEGYSYSKEFFNPRYDRVILPDEKDYRRTLYWNPDVKTDANGKASISFFNNSSCVHMRVSAETVTKNGEIGSLNH